MLVAPFKRALIFLVIFLILTRYRFGCDTVSHAAEPAFTTCLLPFRDIHNLLEQPLYDYYGPAAVPGTLTAVRGRWCEHIRRGGLRSKHAVRLFSPQNNDRGLSTGLASAFFSSTYYTTITGISGIGELR